ncbi:putative GNAT superfamily acetyltransferase [Kitasatospora acidiphila]
MSYRRNMGDELLDAERCAQAAADRSGVTVRALAGLAEVRSAAELLNRVWQAQPSDPVVPPAVLRAYEYSGNYLAGAFRGSRLVAAAVGFLSPGDRLHSDVLGVLPGERGTGVGFAVKQHQRAWALRHGLHEVRWTFDPLLRRNARFNLRSLGAEAVAYLPDFYGPLSDGLNVLEETDRLAVHWRLTSRRATQAARRRLPKPDRAVPSGAELAVDHQGTPASATPDAPAQLVAVPADIDLLRANDRPAAAHWRRVVRTALTIALADGYRIADFTSDGCYLLLPH